MRYAYARTSTVTITVRVRVRIRFVEDRSARGIDKKRVNAAVRSAVEEDAEPAARAQFLPIDARRREPPGDRRPNVRSCSAASRSRYRKENGRLSAVTYTDLHCVYTANTSSASRATTSETGRKARV